MLLEMMLGHLDAATSDNRSKVGFVIGLLRTCREVAWQQHALLEAIDQLLASWDEHEFIRLLPELRIAFAGLTPRETDRVAGAVAGLHGQKDLGELIHYDINQAALSFHLNVTQEVLRSLEHDQLADWA